MRMGPPPRSLAAEANDCFMVRSPCGSNRIQGRGAKVRAQSGLPRFALPPSCLGRPVCSKVLRGAGQGPNAMRYVTGRLDDALAPGPRAAKEVSDTNPPDRESPIQRIMVRAE